MLLGLLLLKAEPSTMGTLLMTALAVIGFILINLVGLALLPRLTAVGYIWYVFTMWGLLAGDDGLVAFIGLVLVIVTIVACILDGVVLFMLLKKEE